MIPRTEAVQNEEQERAPATSRFAAAQQLFRRQQTVPPKPPSPPHIPQQAISSTSASPRRSFTASSSLYNKLGQSIPAETIGPEERARAFSSPTTMAFSQSFGQPKPQHILEPTSSVETKVSQREIPIDLQCILNRPFDMTAINGRTGTGKAAWWCRHDRLVVFDGLTPEDNIGAERHWKRLLVRTSKGLEMSRKNCKKEVIHVDIPCGHCKNVLGRDRWNFEARVKGTRVCEGCQERCWREAEKVEKKEMELGSVDGRRDSFLMQEGRSEE